MHSGNNGFTIVELLVTMAILAISMAVAVPDMRTVLEKNWIRGASEAITAELRYARTEAVKRNMALSITFSEDTSESSAGNWCIGLDENPGCNCTLTDANNNDACALPVAGDNVLKTLSSKSFNKISLNQTFTDSTTSINPTRGTVDQGRVILTSPDGKEMEIQMSALGRVWICSDDFTGYPEC